MKDNQTENKVVTLASMGWSIRRIARELHISRERVRRIVVSNSDKRATTQDSQIKQKTRRTSKLDPYKSYIGDLLEKYPDITGQRVFEHLQEKGYDGGTTIVRDYVKTIREVGSKTPVRMVETLPGQRAAHDWSDCNIQFTAKEPGELTKVTFYSYILGYSRRQYVSVVEDKKQETLFRELIAAFIYMDGVPKEIKSDNQKTCVDRWEPGNPIYNRKYLEFATWYRFAPLTITPHRPQENLKVERPFHYLEKNFLNARKFKDVEDLRCQLQQWLSEVNDTRIHGTTKKRPIDLYTEEHPYLQALPKNHYDTSHVAHLVVNQESCVQWKGYLYIVPQKYMYEICPVRITQTEVIVYSSDGKQLAVHPLAKKGQQGRYVGVHQKRGKKPDLPISDVISRLERFAPEMARYIEQLKRHKPHSWGSHLRRLLALKINYHTDDIMLAVNRALDYNVYEAGDIEGFLKNNSESRYSTRLSIKPRNNGHYNEY
jgi:transposase